MLLSFSIHLAIKLQLSEGSLNCFVIVWITPTSLSRLQGCLFCRFSIDRHTDLERQFNINAEDGKITLATPLDRETNMWHNITIVATETSKYLCVLTFSSVGFIIHFNSVCSGNCI